MYLNFFGLNKDPFKITPDPEFFFAGGNRGAVLEALCYSIAKGEGIVKVVGEVGSGKTMLCRMLECELPSNCEIIYLANPRLNADEILFAIAHELNLELPNAISKLEALSALQKFLVEKHAADRRVVMFIEEAQGMQIDTLEEIRMLSNLETTQEKLLQIVLFGQPELDQKLSLHEIRQLKERITYSFDLAPLNIQEIRDYVYTRLRASGYRGNELFAKSAIKLLAKRSEGLLRRVNILSDKALLAAFSQGSHKVTRKHVLMAVNDSSFDSSSSRAWWRSWPLFASILLVFGLGLGAFHYFSQSPLSDSVSAIELPSASEFIPLIEDEKESGHVRIEEHTSANAPIEPTVTKSPVEIEMLEQQPDNREQAESITAIDETKYLAAGFQMFDVLKFETDLVSPIEANSIHSPAQATH
ncbi:MAG: AAA family ATPase [Pseudomonadota bacterium]